MDNLKLLLQVKHKVKVLRPRIKIIIGRTSEFNEEQYEAYRELGYQLTWQMLNSHIGQTILGL